MPELHYKLGLVTQTEGIVYMYFCTLLHDRGSDFAVYRNTWDGAFQEGDSRLLRTLVRYLMDVRTGVPHVDIRNFTIVIQFSRAVSGQAIIEGLLQSLRNAGFEPLDELCTNVMPREVRAENILLRRLGITWLRGRIAARIGCKPTKGTKYHKRAEISVKKASNRGGAATCRFVCKAASRLRSIR